MVLFMYIVFPPQMCIQVNFMVSDSVVQWSILCFPSYLVQVVSSFCNFPSFENLKLVTLHYFLIPSCPPVCQVQLDSVLENFQMLHHFFFVLCKLMKEGYPSTTSTGGNSSEILNMSQFSSQGGFLRQPAFDIGVDNLQTVVSLRIWEKFCCLISETAWSSVEKCLEKGKAFIDHKISQVFKFVMSYLFSTISVVGWDAFYFCSSWSVKVQWMHLFVLLSLCSGGFYYVECIKEICGFRLLDFR